MIEQITIFVWGFLAGFCFGMLYSVFRFVNGYRKETKKLEKEK